MNTRTYTSVDMRRLELNSEYLGISTEKLMENAGKAVADEIASRFDSNSSITIFGGTGRNGGDGMVVARHLAAMDYDVTFNLIGRENEIKDSSVLANWKSIRSMQLGVKTNIFYDSSLIEPKKVDIIVDALLGTGVKGRLHQPILRAVECINNSEGFKISIDVPTGIDTDSGDILGNAVKAELTITLHGVKRGLKKISVKAGEIKVVNIGIPKEADLFAGPGDVYKVVKDRPLESHKGDFGRLLIIGGNETYVGAPALAGMAALRMGLDLAYIASPEKTAYAISAISPNLITIKLKGDHLAINNLNQFKVLLEKCTAIILGPGLGLHKDTMEAVSKILNMLNDLRKPALLDADALKIFGMKRQKIEFPIILTPHFGEFESLAGKKPSKDLKSRTNDVKNLAKRLGAVVILKGNIDIVSDGIHQRINYTGNPGMTVGGTGDVLSGIIGCILAQGNDCFDSSVAGVFINGAAGDFALKEKGHHLVPTDLIEQIPRVMKDPIDHKYVKLS